MPLNLESIRELNKFWLEGVRLPNRETVEGTLNPFPKTGSAIYVSLYAGASNLSLGGQVESTDPLAGLFNSVFNNKVMSLARTIASVGYGIPTQLDYAKKSQFTGVNSLKFSVSGVLALQDSIETDFLQPLANLAYLTFPSRSYKISADAILDKFEGFFKNTGVNFLANFRSNVGSVLNMVTGDFKSDGEQGWTKLRNLINGITGTAYLLRVPPTFEMLDAGSGLDFRYGKILISDVFIRSMQVSIPTLYYSEGVPSVIEVKLDLETFRPITADLFDKIMRGQAQQWVPDAPEMDVKKDNETWSDSQNQ